MHCWLHFWSRYIHANEDPGGAILVMLPGWADIADIHALLTCGEDEFQRLQTGESVLPHELDSREGAEEEGEEQGGGANSSGWYEVSLGTTFDVSMS